MNYDYITDLIDKFGTPEYNSKIINPLSYKIIKYNSIILQEYQALFLQEYSDKDKKEVPKYVCEINTYARFLRSLICVLIKLEIKHNKIDIKHFGKSVSALRIYNSH
jgi:hypothetical protein